MGRPSKDTVDYFPHYVYHGKTIFTLEAMYGNDGYASWFKILEILGETPGHCFDTNDQANWIYLLAKLKIEESTARNILKTLCDLKAIDEDLYSQGLIWSDNFLAGLSRVYNKRAAEMPIKPSFRPGNNASSGVSVEKTPQSKVKERKEEKSIGEKRKHGTFKNVLLTDEEYSKLCEEFGREAEGKINKLSTYIESKGKKYKSHYATILNWDRNDNRNPQGTRNGFYEKHGTNKVLL